jgi:hypothetical protein
LKQNRGLEAIIVDFITQKEFTADRGHMTRKVRVCVCVLQYIHLQVMSSFVKPLRVGVRAFSDAVTSMPENLFDGVSRGFEGVGKVTKSVLGMFVCACVGYNTVSQSKRNRISNNCIRIMKTEHIGVINQTPIILSRIIISMCSIFTIVYTICCIFCFYYSLLTQYT